MSGLTTTWGQEFCRRLGAPPSLQNQLYFRAWAQAEGGNAANNPFNCVTPMPGSTDYNSIHVQNYVDIEQGLAATVKTITSTNPVYNYPPLLESIIRGYSAMENAQALSHTHWGTASGTLNVLKGYTIKTVPNGSVPFGVVPSITFENVREGGQHLDVYVVQRALTAELGAVFTSETSYYGTVTRTAYSSWQRKLGYSGANADGLPGKTSLTKLGDKYGFTIINL